VAVADRVLETVHADEVLDRRVDQRVSGPRATVPYTGDVKETVVSASPSGSLLLASTGIVTDVLNFATASSGCATGERILATAFGLPVIRQLRPGSGTLGEPELADSSGALGLAEHRAGVAAQLVAGALADAQTR
jgi:hypothetical protein